MPMQQQPIKVTVTLMEITDDVRHDMHKKIQEWIGKSVRDENRQTIGTIDLVYIDEFEVKADVTIDPAIYNQQFSRWIAGCMRQFSLQS
jgi:BMFP domain-containing protein YqiC